MGIRKAYKRSTRFHRGRNRAKRPKTFDSEKKAQEWAHKQGIKSFDVVRLNSGLSKKVKVVVKSSQ